MTSDERKLKSFIFRGDDCFYVSTIERDSSAAVSPPPRFFETIAWDYEWELQARGGQVAITGYGPAFEQHSKVCEQLFRNGCYETEGS